MAIDFFQWYEIQRNRLHTTNRALIEVAFAIAALLAAQPTMKSVVLGGIVAATGLILRIAVAATSQAGTFGGRSGLYRFMSMPDELGSLLIYLGLCFIARDLWLWLFLMMVLALTVLVRPVRRWMLPRDALHQAQSKQGVGVSDVGFFPQLWPATPATEDHGTEILGPWFSLHRGLRVARGGELSRIIAVFAMVGWFAAVVHWGLGPASKQMAAVVVCAAIVMRAMYYAVLYLRQGRVAGR